MPSEAPELRLKRLQTLLGMVVPLETEAISSHSGASGSTQPKGRGRPSLRPLECRDYCEVLNAWRKALEWRQELDDVLSVLLAVCFSTEQVGDQLFLQFIANAGVGKTVFCDALLTSRNCYPLEHVKGFHSGWKEGQDGEDFSLITRINRKTLVTPEGDVIMSSPQFTEIMSQQRRIFDGTAGASFKNMKKDRRYTGLRTPWIIAGTPALMQTDQSRLGDRFLRICIDLPTEEQEDAIIDRAIGKSLRDLMHTSDGTAESCLNPRIAHASRLTGGFIDYLREDPRKLLLGLVFDPGEVIDRCRPLAKFVAYMRARPDPDRKRNVEPSVELGTRLGQQFGRLAGCLAVVLGEYAITEEVYRRVRKVVMDTSRGLSLSIARHLYESEGGSETEAIAVAIGAGRDRVSRRLEFLKHRKVGVVEKFKPGEKKRLRWRLTKKLQELFEEVEK